MTHGNVWDSRNRTSYRQNAFPVTQPTMSNQRTRSDLAQTSLTKDYILHSTKYNIHLKSNDERNKLKLLRTGQQTSTRKHHAVLQWRLLTEISPSILSSVLSVSTCTCILRTYIFYLSVNYGNMHLH